MDRTPSCLLWLVPKITHSSKDRFPQKLTLNIARPSLPWALSRITIGESWKRLAFMLN